MEGLIFYILSAIIIIFSLMSVLSKKILRAAIYLLFVLVSTAGIYFLLDYFFLAAVQITIYAGGIMVLVIFSILLTVQINDKLDTPKPAKAITTGIIVSFFTAICLVLLLSYDFNPVDIDIPVTIEAIGIQLLSTDKNGYILPFEVISILLLAAMIGAIVIAKNEAKVNQKMNKND